MEIKTDGYTMYNKFLVKAVNAEETKPLCIAFFDRFTKNKDQAEPYTMTLLSAKKMKVEAVIDHVFCNEYIDRSKAKESKQPITTNKPNIGKLYISCLSHGDPR